ncbi:MAG: S-methyl-5-thioribose-1-phosphate isomerase, partial [Ignavibacteriaceae bacterium]|nr:S-methyl-5-thioribose-1-phosphate isomerase [Ignavibacteriaceae bacterium]
ASTRPTAVNLFMALDKLKGVFESRNSSDDVYNLLVNEAEKLHEEDKENCRHIGLNSLPLFKKKSTVLTHCNTGLLATGGDGTAFNVIKTAHEHGLVNMVYADETRPLLQGSRLTAFELEKHKIPFHIQSDSSAAVLMQQGKIDLVVTGADRIALNGDSANKIGTYTLAVLCNFHNIPFYIAAPSTTIDRKTISGTDIKIEYRNKAELLSINGNKITPENYEAFTPAFDVTPSHLINGIITAEEVYFFPYNFLR